MSNMIDKQIIQAQRMRKQGLSYRKIADVLGTSTMTVYRILNPEARERYREQGCIRATKCYKIHKDGEAFRKRELERGREYRKAHKDDEVYRESDRERGRKYRKTHKESIRMRSAERYRTRKEHIRECNRKYRKAHLAEHAAAQTVRRVLKLGATIDNLAGVAEIYQRAKEGLKVRCYLCGKLIPKGHRHVDHIIPLSRGGLHRPSNLAVACDKCNGSKGAKMPGEVGVLL